MHHLPRPRDDALLVRAEERKRQAVAEPDRPERRGPRENRRRARRAARPTGCGPLGRRRAAADPAHTSGRRLADQLGDVPRPTITASTPARSSSSTSVARGCRQLGDRELAGGHVGQQVEHALERVVVSAREHEQLRIELLERFLELLLVLDPHGELDVACASHLQSSRVTMQASAPSTRACAPIQWTSTGTETASRIASSSWAL